jgi:APA family basic amino acid/polyamine antiporter
VFACITIYCLVNLAYFVALPLSEILSANSKNFPQALPVATKAVKIFLGDQGITILSAAFVISALGAMNGCILTSSRVPFAMAEAKMFPKVFSFIHSKSKTPVVSILVQGSIACGLALSGSFDQLTDYVVFSSWLFYAMNGVAVMILRQRMPNAERAYKVPLYPVIPVLFVTLSVLLLINTLITSPNESGMGLVIIALGLPFYWLFFRANALK